MITRHVPKADDPRARAGYGLAATLILVAAVLAFSEQSKPQAPSDDAVWAAFIAWYKSAPPAGNPFESYSAMLQKEGLAKEEIARRAGIIVRLFTERPEGPEVVYDRTYARPASGDPPTDGYASVPSEFLIEAVRGRATGAALDVGTGQGRNAVWLAAHGWDVTGIDISGVGLRAAQTNAAKAGVTIRTVKTAYADYDLGTAKWDLVAMIFAWAPVQDPDFMARLRRALRPGGLVVFEHFVKDEEHPYPPMVRPLAPGELKKLFASFEITFYDEREGTGDWGGPGSGLVRMVARKKA